MKKIKPVVLKDATKLTNSEMKSIRGGYEPVYSATCSTACPDGSLGTYDCRNFMDGTICLSSTNGNVNCYHPIYNSDNFVQACPDAPPTK